MVKKRMLVAHEKIRLAQVALQDAIGEGIRHARSSFGRSTSRTPPKEIAPLRQTPPISTVSDLEADVQRLRNHLAQMEVAQRNLCRHPPQSSSQVADMLRERAAKRRAGVTESISTDPQDLECWMSDKYLELREAIQFGDQESILSLTDLLHQGEAQNQKFLSMVIKVVSTWEPGWISLAARSDEASWGEHVCGTMRESDAALSGCGRCKYQWTVTGSRVRMMHARHNWTVLFLKATSNSPCAHYRT